LDCLIGVPIAACMVIPLVAASLGVDRRRPMILWALLFLGLLILDQALLYLPFQTHLNDAFHLHWNWFGKLFVLAWALPFLAFGPVTFNDAGVCKPIAGTTTRAATIVVALALIAFIAHWFLRTGAPRSTETILYQLAMPAIAEELVFRGVLFAVIERAFGERGSIDQPWWQSRAVWLTAIAFALMHGWVVANGTFQFNALACILPLVFGVIAGGLRKYSGSIAFPMVLHSAVNVAAAVFP
jgi:membrane protease YdiL (CAAX protease family)